MRRHHFPRSACATVLTAALLGSLLVACSSPTGEQRSESARSAPAPTAATPTASRSSTTTAAASPAAPFELSAKRVSIRPPRGASFRVRGSYPWSPSRCVRPDRPRLEGRYPGTLWIRTADDGSLTVAVTLTFRRYLEGIAEVPPTWPMAALEAQVIAARSYVLSRTGWTGAQGESLDGSICGTADCQVYGGIPDPRPPGIRRWYEAVRRTRGQVLLFGDRPADTVYFSTSNGRTYGNDEVFGSSPLPYLRPAIERDDGASPLSRWRVELPFDDLETVLGAAGLWPSGAPISSASVDGSTIHIAGGGRTASLDAPALRDAVNTWAPCLLPADYPSGGLPTTIPSGWFGVSSRSGSLVVQGRGWGHGVGMVQWGAYGKARRGWSASRILSFYYGGLTPRPYPEPGSMQVVVAMGLRSLTVVPSRAGATIGEISLSTRKLRVDGGEEVTVSGRGP
jgi:stage II sporulation protein D